MVMRIIKKNVCVKFVNSEVCIQVFDGSDNFYNTPFGQVEFDKVGSWKL